MKKTLEFSKNFIYQFWHRFREANCPYRAAALTYTSLLSLVPLMTVSFAIFSAFPEFNKLSNLLQNFIFANFVAATGETIQEHMKNFMQHAAQLSTIGLLFLIITSISMMLTLEETMNAIWHIKERRSWISALLLYWTILTLSPILMGVGIGLSSYLASISIVSNTAEALGITKHILSITPFLLSILAFMLLYVAVPNCKVPIRYGFYAAVIAAVLFEIAKFGFTFYVAHFPTYQILYGALAAIPLFLLWIYLAWLITLTGAVFSHTFATYRHAGKKLSDPFLHTLHWLEYFWHAQQKGDSVTFEELLAIDQKRNYSIVPTNQITALLDARLIKITQHGNYLLSRDLSKLTLKQLEQLLPWPLPQGELTSYNAMIEKLFKEIEIQTNDLLNQPLANFFSPQEDKKNTEAN